MKYTSDDFRLCIFYYLKFAENIVELTKMLKNIAGRYLGLGTFLGLDLKPYKVINLNYYNILR